VTWAASTFHHEEAQHGTPLFGDMPQSSPIPARVLQRYQSQSESTSLDQNRYPNVVQDKMKALRTNLRSAPKLFASPILISNKGVAFRSGVTTWYQYTPVAAYA
jgi:hypothetical protein